MKSMFLKENPIANKLKNFKFFLISKLDFILSYLKNRCKGRSFF